MKAVVKADELQKALNVVSLGLSTKGIIEQSSCYVFNKGRVWTFNDEVACSCRLPNGMKEFKVAIPHAEINSLLSKMGEGDLDVSYDDEGELIFQKKRRKAGIRVQAEITLPLGDVRMPRSSEEWVEIPKGFAKAVKTVQQCASSDESVPIVTYLHVTPNWIEACDNSQAIRFKIKTGLDVPVLLKRNDLVKAMTAGKMEEWSISESWVHFKSPNNGLVISCRRPAMKYPELGELLKVGGLQSKLPEALIKAVEVAEVFIDEREDTMGLSVELRKGGLRLRSRSEAGWYEEKQRVEYDGDPLQFRIAPKLLQEACRRTTNVCMIGPEKLSIKGERFVYVTCLELGGETL